MKISENLKTKIKNDALARLKERKIEQKTNMHLYTDALEVGQKIKSGKLEVKLDRKTVLVYVDLAPEFNWAHPTEYLLYDAKTGKLHEKVQASFPPIITGPKPSKVEHFHTPVKMVDTAELRKLKKKRIDVSGLKRAPFNATGNRYAVLFSGHSSNRHVNDLEFLYRTLIDIYDFDPANIYVLNHDGTINYFLDLDPPDQAKTIGANLGKWPGDNTDYRMIINGPGTRTSMQTTLQTLANRIQQDDFLFIHINNHGAGPGDGFDDYCIMEYTADASWVGYMVNDFIADLNVLPSFKELMIMMEQCRSGGFVDPIINHSPASRTHIATAVLPDYYSLGGMNFDPFAEDWIAAITGYYPDGSALTMTVDTDQNGLVSAAEAFAYGDAVHNYDGRILGYYQGAPLRAGDTPMSADSPNGCGISIFLGRLIISKPPPYVVVPQFRSWSLPAPPEPGDPLVDIISVLKEGDERRMFFKSVVDYRLALVSAQLEEPGLSRLGTKQLKATETFYKNLQKLFST